MVEWQWYKVPEMVHLFIHLLFIANHKDGDWQGIKIKRGQVVTGRKTLSVTTGISEQSIRTCLTRLKSTSEITIKSTNKFSIITICNYDKYNTEKAPTNQHINQPANQQSTSNQPATNHKQECIKNDKNEKNFLSEKINFEFENFLREQNKPVSELRQKELADKLETLAPGNDDLKIAIIKQAISGGYPDFRQLPEQVSVKQDELITYREMLYRIDAGKTTNDEWEPVKPGDKRTLWKRKTVYHATDY